MALSPVEEPIALEELLGVLGHLHRRRILARLHGHDALAEAEFDQQVQAFTFDSLGVELFHYHLVKLAEAGFIRWDRERGVVRRGPRFHEIAPLIDLVVDHRDELPARWP